MKKIISFLFLLGFVHVPLFALDIVPISAPININIDVIPPLVLEDHCPAGKIWQYLDFGPAGQTWACMECPEGTYNETMDFEGEPITVGNLIVGWGTCPSCSDLQYSGGHYKHTCTDVDDSGKCHDSKNDCYAWVNFHGNDGKGPNNNIDEVVEVHYYPAGDAVPSEEESQCWANNSTSLCTLNLQVDGMNSSYQAWEGRPYRITDGVTTKADGVTIKTAWTKTGYKFAGWYTDSNFDEESLVRANSIFRGDLHLYAKWVCEDGYYLNDSNMCVECDEDYYCAENYKVPCASIGSSAFEGAFRHSEKGAKGPEDCYAKVNVYIGETPTTYKAVWGEQGLMDNGNPILSCRVMDLVSFCKISNVKGYSFIDDFVNLGKVSSGEFILGLEEAMPEHKVFGAWYQNAALTSKVKADVSYRPDIDLYPKFICDRGYYEKETGDCEPCPYGTTTAAPGATSDGQCKRSFLYGENKTWTWPDNIEVVDSFIESPSGGE